MFIIKPVHPPFTDKGVVFGTPLSEGSIAQIYQLIEYLSKSEYQPPRTEHTLITHWQWC